jgi:DNA-binding MarR family transcriptional regulator
MSGRIVGEVFDNAPESLRSAEFLVLLALAEDARDRDRLARFSDANTLTTRTRLAPGTVRNALAVLTRRGLIKPTRRAQTGTHQEWQITELYDYHRST